MGTSDAVLDRENVLDTENVGDVLNNETSVEKENIETEGVEETVHHTLTKAQQKYLPLKRAIDVVLSGGAIVLLSPVLGAVAVAIKLDSPGPVMFKQKRVGRNCEFLHATGKPIVESRQKRRTIYPFILLNINNKNRYFCPHHPQNPSVQTRIGLTVA